MATLQRYTRLLVLGTSCALIAQGCIFSQSFLDGEGNNPADLGTIPTDMARMDATTDAFMEADLGTTPTDMVGMEADSAPDLDSPPLLDMRADSGTACTSDTQCGANEICQSGTCQVTGDLCLSKPARDTFCGVNTNTDCNFFQRVCIPPGLTTFPCELNSQTMDGNPLVCTQMNRLLPGTVDDGSRVAMGSNYAVAMTKQQGFPGVFVKLQGNAWTKDDELTLDLDLVKRALTVLNPNGTKTPPSMVEFTGGEGALDMSEDDSYLAYTISGKATFGSQEVKSNIVLVFKFDGASWKHDAALVPPTVQERDTFGTSIALHGNRIAIGSPGFRSGAGKVYMYSNPLGSMWELGDSCAVNNVMNFGRRVEFSADDKAAQNSVKIYGTGSVGARSGVYGCVDGQPSPTYIIDDVSPDAALSASGDALLIRAPGELQAKLYKVSNTLNVFTAANDSNYALSTDKPAHLVARVVDYGDDTRVLFNSPKKLYFTPGDDGPPNGAGVFNSYITYRPFGQDPNDEIMDADVNADGDIIFIVKGNTGSPVFFAKDLP